MKRITFIAFIFASLFVITGCSKSPEEKFLSFVDNCISVIGCEEDIRNMPEAEKREKEKELENFLLKNTEGIVSMAIELGAEFNNKADLYKNLYKAEEQDEEQDDCGFIHDIHDKVYCKYLKKVAYSKFGDKSNRCGSFAVYFPLGVQGQLEKNSHFLGPFNPNLIAGEETYEY